VHHRILKFVGFCEEENLTQTTQTRPVRAAPLIALYCAAFVSMLQTLATALVATLLWVGAASSHTIQLKAHSRECFHEQLHRDDQMTVTFQVGDREFGNSGNLDIDFFV
jgi:emp24/gp25L/p24 family/GOLD